MVSSSFLHNTLWPLFLTNSLVHTESTKLCRKKQQAYKTTGIRFSYMFCSIAALSWALYTPPCRDGSAGDPASDADTSRCVSSTRGSFPKIVSPYIEVTVFTFDIANSCSRWALFFPEFWGLAPAAWMAYIYIDQRSAICMRVCSTLFILLPLFTLSLQPFNGFNMYLIFHSVDLLPVLLASTLILLSVRSHLTPLLLLLNIPLCHAASHPWKMEKRPSSERGN